MSTRPQEVEDDRYMTRYQQVLVTAHIWCHCHLCILLDRGPYGARRGITSERLPKASYTFHLMTNQMADHPVADSLLLEHVANVQDDDGDPYLAKMKRLAS